MEKTSMLITKGEVIAIPTDTVYGLICDIYNKKAVEKIFSLKQRPYNKPLVALCNSIRQIEKICINIPAHFYTLANEFLPGPLTIVLKKNNNIPDFVTCGMETIAVRIPKYDFINKLITKTGIPLASTSANISDNKPNTNASDVLEILSNKIQLVIDGGNSPLGIESTIVDISADKIKILREGYIKKERLLNYLK